MAVHAQETVKLNAPDATHGVVSEGERKEKILVTPSVTLEDAHHVWGFYYKVGVERKQHHGDYLLGVGFSGEIGVVRYLSNHIFITGGIGYQGDLDADYQSSWLLGDGVRHSLNEKMHTIKIPVCFGYDFGGVSLSAGLYLSCVVSGKVHETLSSDTGSVISSENYGLDDYYRGYRPVIPGICLSATFFNAVSLEYGFGLMNRFHQARENYWQVSLGAKCYF